MKKFWKRSAAVLCLALPLFCQTVTEAHAGVLCQAMPGAYNRSSLQAMPGAYGGKPLERMSGAYGGSPLQAARQTRSGVFLQLGSGRIFWEPETGEGSQENHQDSHENHEEDAKDESSLADEANTGEESNPDDPSVSPSPVGQADLGVTAKAAVLMEASTGTILYEKNSDTQLSPASITKIMTLILIFDTINAGKLKLTDEVTTSAYAKSMGGSQVFLEEGEKQTVETLIKCIVVASGNDASVAMAEHIAGSEAEFVKMMNERAAGLHMDNTNFEDCCGLTDSLTHLTSARDVAIMSRELITRYPQISDYSTIWMENITHVTKKGTEEFGLANTNKLLKMSNSFEVTGLKTGSTSLAKYCLSATAKKDGVELIAVVMGAPDYKVRFSQAQTMLNYGFANCSLYSDDPSKGEVLPPFPVRDGVGDTVALEYAGTFSYLSLGGEDFQNITKELVLDEGVEAPVEKGQKCGKLIYRLGDKEIGSVEVQASEAMRKAEYTDYLKSLAGQFWL